MVVIQALITALLSGLFSGAVLFALHEHRDRAETELKCLEELYASIDRWCMGIMSFHQHIWETTHSSFEYHQFDAKDADLNASIDLAYSRMAFLLDVWAPDLRTLPAPMLKIASELIPLRTSVLAKRVNGEALVPSDFQYLAGAAGRFNQEKLNALSLVAVKARRIANRPRLIQLRPILRGRRP